MKTQRCGGCKRSLTRDKFFRSKWGKKNRWCRACFRGYSQRKKWASKAGPWEALLSGGGTMSLPPGRRGSRSNVRHLRFSCGRCHRVVRPRSRELEVDDPELTTAIVLAFSCRWCNNSGIVKIATRLAK